MGFSFVSATGKQSFTTALVGQLVTDPFAVAAGDGIILVLRTEAAPASGNTSAEDTAGNTYREDGAAVGLSPGFVFLSCLNCKAHATNVVTITYPVDDFTAVTAIVVSSDAPLGMVFDRLFSGAVYTAADAVVSCTPNGRYTHQLAIIASDRQLGGFPTFGPPSASWTTVDSSGPGGNGPHMGNGSHSVGYQINDTRFFDGSVVATATWGDPAVGLGKTIGVALYGMISPIAYEDPCAIVDPRYIVKLETEDETLQYSSKAIRDSADRGGFKEPRVIEIGPCTRAASDISTGAWSAQTGRVTLADTDRVNRARVAARPSFRNCAAEFYLAGRAHLAAGGSPRIVFSGKVYSNAADPNLALTLEVNDLLGIDYSLFSEEKMIPQRETKTDFFPELDEATLGIGEPILGGRLAPLRPDEGEGVVDCPFVGALDIGAIPGVPTGVTLADVVNDLEASHAAGTLYEDFGSRIGYADANVLQGMGAVPTDYDGLAQVIGYGDLDALLAATSVTPGSTYVACLVASHAISEILDGDNGDPSIWIDDVQVDPAEIGVSIWCPNIPGDGSWASTFGALYTDLVGTDGVTRRYTFVLFDAASAYGLAVIGGARVHLDCIGLEDVGDGTGEPILDYYALYLHVLVNFILQNYLSGAWLSIPEFLFVDGVTMLPRVREDSFAAASAVVVATSLAEGRRGRFKIGNRTSTRDIVREFNYSGGCRLGQDDFGRLFCQVLDRRRDNFLATPTGTTHRTLRDKVDILPGFKLEPKPEWQVNKLAYQYAMNYYTGKYERRFGGGGDVAPVEDEGSQDRNGVIMKTAQFQFLGDDESALDVARYYVALFSELPHVAHYTRRGLCGLEDDVLAGVPITHFNGYGSGGWITHTAWIDDKTFDGRTMTTTFRAFDVEHVIDNYENPPTPPELAGLLRDPVGGDFLYSDDGGAILTEG